MRNRGLVSGSVSGLVAGLVSGAALQSTWILPPLSLLIAKRPTLMTGWLVHLVVSVTAGALFGLSVEAAGISSRRALFVWGLAAGAGLFVLGPLTLVPMAIGLPPQFAFIGKWLKVGAGYLVFGAVLGAVYSRALGGPVERRV